MKISFFKVANDKKQNRYIKIVWCIDFEAKSLIIFGQYQTKSATELGYLCGDGQGTIPILRQQRDCVGEVRKMIIFADVQYYSLQSKVGGSEKVQKSTDVI